MIGRYVIILCVKFTTVVVNAIREFFNHLVDFFLLESNECNDFLQATSRITVDDRYSNNCWVLPSFDEVKVIPDSTESNLLFLFDGVSSIEYNKYDLFNHPTNDNFSYTKRSWIKTNAAWIHAVFAWCYHLSWSTNKPWTMSMSNICDCDCTIQQQYYRIGDV